MDGAQFIESFRDETTDELEPYLWSDELILRYLSSAQNEFCRLTDGISDSVSDLCTVKVDSLTTPISPLIKKISRATLIELDRPLSTISVNEARERGMTLSCAPGIPKVIVTGVGKGKAQFFPPPIQGQSWTVHLDVYRYPLSDIAAADAKLEVEDHYAPCLMQYVLHRAYARPDADTMDLRRSNDSLASFRASCKEALAEQSRTRTKSSIVNFSW